MCCIECHVCGCSLFENDSPRSSKYGMECCQSCEHAYPHYQKLQEQERSTQRRLHEVWDGLEDIVSDASEQLKNGADEIVLSRKRLMQAVRLIAGDRQSDSECVDEHYTRVWVAAMACRIFSRTHASEPLKKKLELLREASAAHGRAIERSPAYEPDLPLNAVLP